MANPTIATLSSQKYQFLSGGGEMGALMRAKNWSDTPVGAPDHWPQSLRTALSIILHAKFPMFLWWGPELACFYNDAYRPSLGNEGKHPGILGEPAEQAWTEIWHIIKPLIDQVLAGGEAPYFEDTLIPIYRNGKIEDVYWTFSYSAVNDESGKPAGVFVTCVETTDKIVNARQVEHGEQKFKNLINESPIATAVFTGEDFIIELANEEALKLWGKDKSVIGKKIITAMSELEGQPYMDLLKNVYTSGETYYGDENYVDIEVEGKIVPTYVNFICKALRDSDGKIYGILTMGYNVTEQVEARKKTEYNEERLRLTAETAMLGTFDLKLPEREFTASKRLYEIFGFADTVSYDHLFSVLHPDDVHIREEANRISRATGRIGYEVRLIWPDLSIRWISAYGKVFYREDGSPMRVLGTIMDITAQKKTLSDITSGEKRFRNTVMQATVGIAILRGPSFFVEMANNNYLELVDKKEEEFVGKNLFDAIPEVKESVEDLLTNVYNTGERFTATEFAMPVKRNGVVDTCYFNFEYEALREEDNSISGIIVTVNEVTSIVKAKYLLAESEKGFRNVIEHSPIPMAIIRGADYVIETGNIEMFANIWRRKEEDVIGKKLFDVFPQLNNQKYPDILKDVFEKGITHRENESVAYVHGDGGTKKFYFNYEYAPLFDTDGKVSGIMITVYDVTENVARRLQLEIDEARLRLATEGTKLSTWDLDLTTHEIFHSPRLAEIFGHDPAYKMPHGQMRDQMHPDDRRTIVERAFDVAMENGFYDYVARIIKPDQTVGWIKTQGKVIYGANGLPLRMIGTLADITENKIVEERLAMLAAIVQSSEDAIISKTLEGFISSWNDGAEKVFGYTAGEIIGQHVTKLIPLDRFDEEPQILRRIQQGESVEHFETKRITKDNQILDISLTISPIRNTSGKIIGASKIARDITKQKQTERAITENQLRLNIAIQAAELGTWEYDVITGATTYSDRYLEIFGHQASRELTRESVLDQIHPDDVLMRNQAVKNAIEQTGTMSFDARIIVNQNEVRWIQAKGKLVYDEDNVPVKLMGTIMDITDEKIFNDKLQKSELLFKTISNASPVGLWMTDISGQNVFVNDTWIKWTGLPLEDHYGQGWLSRVIEEDKLVIPSFEQVFIRREKYMVEFRLMRLDGELRWCLTEGYPFYNINGDFEGYAGSVTDITDIKRLEQQKDFFISMASHELKTPITSIKGYVQILMSMHKESPDTFLKNSLATVNKQIGTLTKLIVDLLDMSKIKSGSLQLNREDFSINDMIRETIEEIKHTQPDYAIVFLPERESIVYADRIRIAQVLINFLTNAIKYSPHFNMVTIKSDVINNNVVVSVIDSGIGISKHDQEKIFQRFYRVEGKDEKTFPGFGIGLFIAAEIIQRHDGQIAVESEPGKGSVFSFSLPLEK